MPEAKCGIWLSYTYSTIDLNFKHSFVSQYSDSDSEAEYPAIVPEVPSAVPVTGESYCSCDSQMELGCSPRLRGYTHLRDCHCGEDDQGSAMPVLLITVISLCGLCVRNQPAWNNIGC